MTDPTAQDPQTSGYAFFEDVLNQELDAIAQARGGEGEKEGKDYARARAMNLSALAFSGGGIRSAVFNLGFIQGLANKGVIHGFDYLSTVSGGGYIGGWLSALLRRKNGGKPTTEADVRRLEAEFLAVPPKDGEQKKHSGFPAPESKPVRFIRRYADYLDPRLGLSGDTLALISLIARNVAVMQMLLVSMLVAIFSLLLLLGGVGGLFSCHDWETPVYIGVGLLMVALVIALQSQRSWRRKGEAGLKRPNAIIFFGVLLPALVSGVFLAVGLGLAGQAGESVAEGLSSAPVFGMFLGVWLRLAGQAGESIGGVLWLVVPMLVYAVAWLFSLRSLRAWVGMLGGTATLGGVLYIGASWLPHLLADAPFGHAVAFAPPVAFALQSLVITVHLALAGSGISEQSREWWARAGGQGMFLALAWTLAFCFILYAPPVIAYGAEWSAAAGGLWAALSWVGAQLARGKDTGGGKGTAWKEIGALVAPWLFLVGMLALVAWAFASALPWVNFDGCCTLGTVVEAYQDSLARSNCCVMGLVLGLSAALFGLLVGFVDLNIFSAHSFYRNRLARTFMGASRDERKPNVFTGFDRDDDLDLKDMAGQRPFHLINANLNLTGGEELAWQTRRGASFTFSPHHCGYWTTTTMGVPIGGYRPTAEYAGGLSLATVVAVSGAAVSPNMGFHTSTSVAALLTAFNLRLARWCPNPTKEQWRKDSPTLSAAPLFAELFGNANGLNPWLNLSDGGQFDNLGLYELVRRRAAFILVTDVSADGSYEFDDLAMVVRKLSVDFGVDAEFPEGALGAIRPTVTLPGGDPDKPVHVSQSHWALGCIHYPDAAPGYLIYVKSSLTEKIPVDIRQYRDAHPTFPHETTADQWFDEDQFEAYRHLGQDIAEALMGLFGKSEVLTAMSGRQLSMHLYDEAARLFKEPKTGTGDGAPKQGDQA